MAMPKIMEEGSSIQLTKKSLQMDLTGERGSNQNECHPMVQGYMTTVPILQLMTISKQMTLSPREF